MILVLCILTVIYLALYFLRLPPSFDLSFFYIINSIMYLILTVWYMYKYKKDNLLCFELFFSISFWLACFFAVFVMDSIESPIVMKQMYGFNNTLLYRSCTLSMLGYLFYMLGLCLKNKKQNDLRFYTIRQNPSINKTLNIVTAFCIVLFFLLGGYNFINTYDQSVSSLGMDSSGFGKFESALTFSIIFLNISTVSNIISLKRDDYNTLRSFIGKINKLFLFNVLIMSVFLLMCGYRSGAMQIVIPFIAILSINKILSTRLSFLIMGLGVCLLVIVGLLRSGNSSISEIGQDMSLALFFRDFTSANSALPSLIEYVDINGAANYRNTISQILAIFPFLQTIFFGAFGNDMLMISSSQLYTQKISHSYYSGLGTNLIGDLYYTGGFLCVLVFMFLLGRIISYISQSRNKYVLVIWMTMLGNAVFMARVEYFYIARKCALGVILYWLITFLLSHKPSKSPLSHFN